MATLKNRRRAAKSDTALPIQTNDEEVVALEEAAETEVEESVESSRKTKKEKPARLVWNGDTEATYRRGAKLTPLRHDYKASVINDKDVSLVRELASFADEEHKVSRRNLDAGRLGRLFVFGFVDFEETGIADYEQSITITEKGLAFVRPTRAA
jgi:hypothetical protein